jgi:prephenate dehydrogenase
MKPVRIGVIGGTNGMGRWFARFLRRQGLDVAVCDEKTKRTPAGIAGSCDVVVVSVPIGITVEVIESVGPLIRKDGLLMDLTSLKVSPVAAMLGSSRCEVIGCHPLFGPRVRSAIGRRIVLCPARTKHWLSWLKSTLQAAGLLIVETTPEEHDRGMALVQGLNHANSLLMGLVLRDAGIGRVHGDDFNTPAFEEKMKLVRKVLHPNARLSAEIIMSNPHLPVILDQYEKKLADLKALIRKRDTQKLIACMEHLAACLWPDDRYRTG